MLGRFEAWQTVGYRPVQAALEVWLETGDPEQARGEVADSLAWDAPTGYREYVYDRLREDWDPDERPETLEAAGQWLVAALVSMRLMDAEEWRAERDADLYDEAMERRIDQFRETGRRW